MGREPISRRTVLRGIGVTMTLPLLEAMEPLTAFAGEKTGPAAGAAPVRMAVLYMPNGVHPKRWTPERTGADFALSPILEPLKNVKDDLLVLTELMNHHSTTGDGHYYKVAPFLTGTEITKTTGADVRVGGVSLDQLIASQIGNLTPLPSLELSVEAPWTFVDTNVGLTTLYGGHISWNTPTTPMAREINPQMAFDRLFRRKSSTTGASLRDRSVLDAVLNDARRLQRQVGQADRLKLNEYFEAVRSVERRITFDAARRQSEVMDDPILRAEIEKLGGRLKDYYAVPEGKRGIDHTEQVRLMMDIIALGFWSDSTRVSTFMFGNEVSGRNFAFLPGVNTSHHETSHHENRAEKMEMYYKINRWHMEQYAYLLEKLKSIKEGDRNLLDNSMILLGSGMRDGNAHSPYNLPIVLAGKGGNTIATGRHLTYAPRTPLCNLYVGMARRMGVTLDRFGDSTQELPGLSDPHYRGVTGPA
ncbi:MAG: DUF1552 domain-containing protein [Capsulimonadales bacterium]|nr:DUF1552 domain-containing protein [Capsulimonadales bacterium]